MPSGLVCHDSASSGTGVMSGSKRTSWLYVSGDRRLRDSAGTSCGSRPVASVVWALISVPPALAGVCAWATRPATPSAPTARPVVVRNWRRFNSRDMAVSLSLAGVEDVAQAVADQVEGEHRHHDREPGK